MTSVVIAAHNEERLLPMTLTALAKAAPDEHLDVVVVANGCTDATVEVAHQAGVRVIDRAEPGKAAAMNAGEAVVSGFPRVFLDADITLPPGGLTTLAACFSEGEPPLAVVPARQVDVSKSAVLVRAYFAINSRLPAFQSGLFGRGVIALSERGRMRFETLPEMVADDLFLDSLFSAGEKHCCCDVVVVVHAPRRTRDLLRRLVRVRRGNAAMRDGARRGRVPVAVRPADRLAWYRDVVRGNPRLLPAAAAYVGITLLVAVLARLRPHHQGWGRDASTRQGDVLTSVPGAAR